ncbi:MAG: hypothetical protein RJB61_1879 [Actinomycetota bacterium]
MTFAMLGMYPFEHLRAHYDHLWTALRRQLADDSLPDSLDWGRDLHASWLEPDLVLGQTCGWPLVTVLDGRVAVVGSFDVDAPWASGGRYRSVLVARRPVSVHDLRSSGDTVVAVNSLDSLSGWVSLCHAWGGRPPRILETGAHRESMRAVAEGRAHLASIDAVSYEHLVHAEPAQVSSVHIVGHGPVVPSLPLICSLDRASTVPALRDALGAVIADPQMAPTLQVLRIRGFVPFERGDFEGLLAMAPPGGG